MTTGDNARFWAGWEIELMNEPQLRHALRQAQAEASDAKAERDALLHGRVQYVEPEPDQPPADWANVLPEVDGDWRGGLIAAGCGVVVLIVALVAVLWPAAL